MANKSKSAKAVKMKKQPIISGVATVQGVIRNPEIRERKLQKEA